MFRYARRRSALPAAARPLWMVLALTGMVSGAAGQVIVLASVDSGGVQGDNTSQTERRALSADGRWVVFESLASNLVSGDTNGTIDVFARDLTTGITTRVSVDSIGAEADGLSSVPLIAGGGSLVVFTSQATNLVPADTNALPDVFVHEFASGMTQRVSVTSGGVEANGTSTPTWVSADGRLIAFTSTATNLVPFDTNAALDVFLHDRLTGTTERVSVGTGGLEPNDQSDLGWLSDNGRFVAFQSRASNLAAGDFGVSIDVFVHDRATLSTLLVSTSSTGGNPSADCHWPTLSDNGRYVAFTSAANNVVAGDTNGASDVFVRDLVAGTTSLVSVTPALTPANGASFHPSITPDGRFVVFSSGASNLVAGDANGTSDIFVRDLFGQTTRRASEGPGGLEPNGASSMASITPDGRVVTFWGFATNLVLGDTNAVPDVFVCDRVLPPAFGPFCAGDGLDASHATTCPCANTGAAANGCANSVNPAGGALAASGATVPDSILLSVSGLPATVGCVFFQGNAVEDAAFGDGVRCAGGTLLRLGTTTTAAGMAQYPNGGAASVSVRGQVVPGSGVRRWYQVYYRNATALYCPPETFNVTNGWVIDW